MTELDQTKTPLLDAVLAYAHSGVARFHMPGHKGGQAADERLKQALGSLALAMDATGVPGLDDLHQPQGVIREAQELAAAAFGADQTFFLVGGTSAGVQAMIMAACKPGEKLIIGRNLHKSAQAGLVHSGARPIYLQPEVDPDTAIGLGVSPDLVRETIRLNPDASAVLLVSPTYQGVASDLTAIAPLVHQAGMALLVDEAHGAHFSFHEAFPEAALTVGADMCSHGIHKVLGSLTQASMLHLKGSRIDQARVHGVLQTLQSTSASYLLLASLDAARRQAVLQGRNLLNRTLELARLLRSEVAEIQPLKLFEPGLAGRPRPSVAGLDPLKVNVDVSGLGLSGQQVEELLRQRWNVQAEMSDLASVLFMLGPGSREEDVVRLTAALRQLAGDWRSQELTPSLPAPSLLPPPLPPQELTPREAFYSHSETVPFQQARGCVSAELITCYPPGIPIICPGERFTAETMDYLEQVVAQGLRLSGPADPKLHTVAVL